MAGSGFNSQNMKLAREMLEACRFSYKMYAQSCQYPLDPFFESHGASDSARNRLMAAVHGDYRTSSDITKFDPVDYDLLRPPSPSEGVIYRGGIQEEPYILLQPREFDRKISFHAGFDLAGKPVKYGGGELAGATGRRRCAFFQGRTGMTATWRQSGWPTWLGAVVYDPETGKLIIVFRGSRSGNGARALMGAKFSSAGSPDWVTDMNYLKTEAVEKFNGAQLSCGFYYAYESCKHSLKAAIQSALGGAAPRATYVTGHSLGGALAQVAYLDLSCGDLARDLLMARPEAWSPLQCFALSAPPVIVGRASHHRLALDADVTQVMHYFCPGDAVHSSPLLDTSLIPKIMRVGGWVLENFSHPLTSPVHIGSEIALESRSLFPESHEPRDVFKGLNAGTLDETFWPTFTFAHTSPAGPYISNFTGGALDDELRAALELSLPPDRALARAIQWKNVIESKTNAETVTQHIDLWQEAVELVDKLRARSPKSLSERDARVRVKEIRQTLVNGARATSQTATSSCYWTLLQGLSAREHYLL